MRNLKDKHAMAAAYHLACNEIARRESINQDELAQRIGIGRDAPNRLKMGYTTVKKEHIAQSDAAFPGFKDLYENALKDGPAVSDLAKEVAEIKDMLRELVDKSNENMYLRNTIDKLLSKVLGPDDNNP